MNVTAIQTTVLITTVTSMTVACALGSFGANRGAMKANARRLTAKLAIMAEISLHALMRHQYQRRISTSPVPAPRASKSSHAFSMLESCDVTASDAKNSSTVVQRET